MGDKSVGVLRGVGPTKIGGGRGPSLDESGSAAVCDSLNERSFEFCKFIVSACESDSGCLGMGILCCVLGSDKAG